MTSDGMENLGAVLDTYKCLLSCRQKMPGMKLEDAFSPSAVEAMKKEQEWLLDLQERWGPAPATEGLGEGECPRCHKFEYRQRANESNPWCRACGYFKDFSG